MDRLGRLGRGRYGSSWFLRDNMQLFSNHKGRKGGAKVTTLCDLCETIFVIFVVLKKEI